MVGVGFFTLDLLGAGVNVAMGRGNPLGDAVDGWSSSADGDDDEISRMGCSSSATTSSLAPSACSGISCRPTGKHYLSYLRHQLQHLSGFQEY